MTVLFGYIKPFKPEMKVREFDTYKAIYCGLCRQLKEQFGLSATFALSYDQTFLSVLSLAIHEKEVSFERKHCAVNPLQKKPCATCSEDLTFAAATTVLMVYYKVLDDYQDGTFFEKVKNLLILPWFWRKRKKAEKRYPQLGQVMRDYIAAQKQLERHQEKSIDRAAEPTANALSEIFAQLLPADQDRRALTRLGYLIGRYVYLIDALDDLKEDQTSGNYNVFAIKAETEQWSAEQTKDYATEVVNLTVGQIAQAYELLTIYRLRPILDNIIYLGLHDSLKRVLRGEKVIKREK